MTPPSPPRFFHAVWATLSDRSRSPWLLPNANTIIWQILLEWVASSQLKKGWPISTTISNLMEFTRKKEKTLWGIRKTGAHFKGAEIRYQDGITSKCIHNKLRLARRPKDPAEEEFKAASKPTRRKELEANQWPTFTKHLIAFSLRNGRFDRQKACNTWPVAFCKN